MKDTYKINLKFFNFRFVFILEVPLVCYHHWWH